MYRNLIGCAFALMLAASLAAQDKPAGPSTASPGSAALPTEATVDSFMQQSFGYDSSLSWRIVDIKPSEVPGLAAVNLQLQSPQGGQNVKLYVSPDGKYAFAGEPMPFGARPFDTTRDILRKGINGPTRGPSDSPVTIVEFSDFQCPHCKEAAPVVEQLLAAEPKARFVFQNYPLPSHNWAAKAANYADCIGRSSNDAFWKFSQKVFAAQAEITEANADEKLKAAAADAGADAAAAATCAAKPETAERVGKSLELGKSVGVSGTPTVFVNGRRLNLGMPADVLKQIVEFEAKNN